MAQPPSHTDSASNDEISIRNSANSDPLASEIEEMLSIVADWPRPHNLLISTDEGDLRRGQFSSEHSAAYASSGAMSSNEQPRARDGASSEDPGSYPSSLEMFLFHAALYRLEQSNNASNIPPSSSQDSFADAPAGSLDDSRKRPRKGLRGSSAAKSHASTSSSRSQASTSSSEVVDTDHSLSRPGSEDSGGSSSRHSDEIRADGRSSRPSPSLASSAYFSVHSVDIA